jgi:hypothetical protein
MYRSGSETLLENLHNKPGSISWDKTPDHKAAVLSERSYLSETFPAPAHSVYGRLENVSEMVFPSRTRARDPLPATSRAL